MKSHRSPAQPPRPALIIALSRPECYPHPVRRIRLRETHISWVLLTGNFAYKIKKPVNMGFLDFSTLEARRRYCELELRLNRRLAPELYLEVVEIRGTPHDPRVGGDGPVIEYAVKMLEFPQRALASRMLARDALTTRHVDRLAGVIAAFHAGAAAASPADRYGTPGVVLAPALENFRQTLPRLLHASDRKALEALRRWTRREHALRRTAIAGRRKQGFVRECHGDLHLGNVAVLAGRPVAFDCIEFSEELRWIDVMSEAAFMRMDLEDRGRRDLAWRFLNRYLEATGDYAGLEVLRYYAVYRAMVRAKVHALRAEQARADRSEWQRLLRASREYLRLARRFTARRRPLLIITHGLSGSGKTTATDSLIALIGAVRVRSDIERKRLHGLAPLARSGSPPDSGIYTPQVNAATYERLAQLAQGLVAAGHSVVVDAAFLRRTERDAFRALARRCRASFLILDFRAPEGLLRRRVARRLRRGRDASEAGLAVLEHQLAAREPLAPQEARTAVAVDTTRPVSAGTWRPALKRLRRAGVRWR